MTGSGHGGARMDDVAVTWGVGWSGLRHPVTYACRLSWRWQCWWSLLCSRQYVCAAHQFIDMTWGVGCPVTHLTADCCYGAGNGGRYCVHVRMCVLRINA